MSGARASTFHLAGRFFTALGSVGTASDPFALGVAVDHNSNRCFLAKRSSPRLVTIDTGTGASSEQALGQETMLLAVESGP